jgi:hypothetical protein
VLHGQALESRQNDAILLRGQQHNNEDEEQKIAESFALHLNDIFSTPTQISMDPELPDTPNTPASTAETITPDEIIQALTTCKASGAPGTDNITNNMLKKSPPNILARLSEIFNASLNLSHLPPAWKKSKIKMIHKQKKQRTTSTPTVQYP